ncbi:hypothetical protein PIB30_057701 [Stylosanthes scabra]|uniref:Uncharacterized protein n=1 Tax=Stylosanthes scabra TaxID=79078 RepID=A0ABU6WJL7_9FABA|nr:hypothetical protein [Stylosanthes scabra]
MGSSGSVETLRKKSKFLAPKYNCGAYPILFMSSTIGNFNRLFYGCPYFKGREKQIENQQIESPQFDVKVTGSEDRHLMMKLMEGLPCDTAIRDEDRSDDFLLSGGEMSFGEMEAPGPSW